jgi:DNA-directed RNA polymerase subunit beta'
MPATTTPPLTGPEAIEYALSQLNLDDLEAEQREVIRAKKKTARPRAVRLLHIIGGLRKNKIEPTELMLRSVPVIPPKFRPFSVTGNTFLPGDANEMYRDIVEYRRLYDRTEKDMGREGANEVYSDMAAAVKAAYGYGDSPNPKIRSRGVKGFFDVVSGSSPKTSFYQSRMLSKPLDTVGRGVIIPDADYGMDDVGIPEEMAWKLFGNYTQRRMVRGGLSPSAALKHIRDRTPQARKALDAEIPERPVVITRSPAWHRTNVIGQTGEINHNSFCVGGSPLRHSAHV